MPRVSARVAVGNFDAAFSEFYRFAEQRAEAAALIATDRARRSALGRLRSDMQAAGLGRLGNGLSSTSDLAEGRGVHRYGNGGFSASGTVFIRSRSERTRGAIEAYTEGAEIRPRRGRWLWIATDQIPRVTGRFRMTPELWIRNGFDRKIGPLVRVTANNGMPLLIVRNVGVAASGKSRSARSLLRSGRPRKGQVATDIIVAFIGIPHTSRQARIDVAEIMRSAAAELPQLFYQALGRI